MDKDLGAPLLSVRGDEWGGVKLNNRVRGKDGPGWPQLPTLNYFTLHYVFPKVTFPLCLHPVKIWLQTVSGYWRNQEISK